MTRVRNLVATCLVVGAAFLIGCDKKEPAPSGGPVAGPQQQQSTATGGRGVFETQGCANCHAVGSTPAKGKGQAPDLGAVATNGKYTRDTLNAFIKNPPKKPYGGMPAYEGKINDDDMGKLCDYLLEKK